jgi:hypothetical protein
MIKAVCVEHDGCLFSLSLCEKSKELRLLRLLREPILALIHRSDHLSELLQASHLRHTCSFRLPTKRVTTIRTRPEPLMLYCWHSHQSAVFR